jgi:hypothetical protein
MNLVRNTRPSGQKCVGRIAGLALAALLGLAQLAPGQSNPTAPPEAGQEQPAQPAQGPLYIDEAQQPTISIAWVQRDGTRVELTRSLAWGTKNDRIDLGMNVLAFAAVGGTRIDLQRGHPLGSVVRVGFYKNDKDKPFFTDIQPGSTVEVRLEGVRFLEPARATQSTALHHLQYSLDDVLNCGLDGSAIDQYNTAAADETLGGQVTKDNGRPGVLRIVRGAPPADAPRYYHEGGEAAGDTDPQPAERFATVRFTRDEKTGAVSLRAELPYEIFRHVKDPWMRTEPGTFFEPTHFHVEFESLPTRAIAPEVLQEEDRQQRRNEQEIVGP